MYTIQELSTTLDDLTEGGLYALNYVAKNEGLTPFVWATPDGTESVILFVGLDAQGRVQYFDYARTPSDTQRDEQIRTLATKREHTSTPKKRLSTTGWN